jgi:hypothetical protein
VPGAWRGLPPDVEDDLDAFLKRYEQLVNTIQDELFKVVAIVGGEDVRGLARREVAEPMDRHLNAAYEAVPDLLAAHEGVRRYLERRLPGG